MLPFNEVKIMKTIEQHKEITDQKTEKDKLIQFTDSLQFTNEVPKIQDTKLNNWLLQTIQAIEITKHSLKEEINNLK